MKERIERLKSALAEMPRLHWKKYLDAECDNDDALREEVLNSLATSAEVESEPATRTLDKEELIRDLEAGSNQTIGGYRILQSLGAGGMGQVYMAEQLRPVRRRVALKVIKADSPSKEILARFEAERQALAMMDHQSIAKVVDAGMTENGLPFFAMELVKGLPITEYCDKFKLSLERRLTLFNQVARAVQHAHQKGIIHRDIKPSNILVSEIDGEPTAKVIDFGLAQSGTRPESPY